METEGWATTSLVDAGSGTGDAPSFAVEEAPRPGDAPTEAKSRKTRARKAGAGKPKRSSSRPKARKQSQSRKKRATGQPRATSKHKKKRASRPGASRSRGGGGGRTPSSSVPRSQVSRPRTQGAVALQRVWRGFCGRRAAMRARVMARMAQAEADRKKREPPSASDLERLAYGGTKAGGMPAKASVSLAASSRRVPGSMRERRSSAVSTSSLLELHAAPDLPRWGRGDAQATIPDISTAAGPASGGMRRRDSASDITHTPADNDSTGSEAKRTKRRRPRPHSATVHGRTPPSVSLVARETQRRTRAVRYGTAVRAIHKDVARATPPKHSTGRRTTARGAKSTRRRPASAHVDRGARAGNQRGDGDASEPTPQQLAAAAQRRARQRLQAWAAGAPAQPDTGKPANRQHGGEGAKTAAELRELERAYSVRAKGRHEGARRARAKPRPTEDDSPKRGRIRPKSATLPPPQPAQAQGDAQSVAAAASALASYVLAHSPSRAMAVPPYAAAPFFSAVPAADAQGTTVANALQTMFQSIAAGGNEPAVTPQALSAAAASLQSMAEKVSEVQTTGSRSTRRPDAHTRSQRQISPLRHRHHDSPSRPAWGSASEESTSVIDNSDEPAWLTRVRRQRDLMRAEQRAREASSSRAAADEPAWLQRVRLERNRERELEAVLHGTMPRVVEEPTPRDTQEEPPTTRRRADSVTTGSPRTSSPDVAATPRGVSHPPPPPTLYKADERDVGARRGSVGGRRDDRYWSPSSRGRRHVEDSPARSRRHRDSSPRRRHSRTYDSHSDDGDSLIYSDHDRWSDSSGSEGDAAWRGRYARSPPPQRRRHSPPRSRRRRRPHSAMHRSSHSHHRDGRYDDDGYSPRSSSHHHHHHRRRRRASLEGDAYRRHYDSRHTHDHSRGHREAGRDSGRGGGDWGGHWKRPQSAHARTRVYGSGGSSPRETLRFTASRADPPQAPTASPATKDRPVRKSLLLTHSPGPGVNGGVVPRRRVPAARSGSQSHHSPSMDGATTVVPTADVSLSPPASASQAFRSNMSSRESRSEGKSRFAALSCC